MAKEVVNYNDMGGGADNSGKNALQSALDEARQAANPAPAEQKTPARPIIAKPGAQTQTAKPFTPTSQREKPTTPGVNVPYLRGKPQTSQPAGATAPAETAEARQARLAESLGRGYSTKSADALYQDVKNRMGITGKSPYMRSESTDKVRSQLNDTYEKSISPLYYAYKKAEEGYKAGNVDREEYLAARREYQFAYNQYAPVYNALELMSDSSTRDYWNTAELGEAEANLHYLDDVLDAGGGNLTALYNRLEEAAGKYESAMTAFEADKTEKNRQAALDAYDQYSTLLGQYNAQEFVLSEMYDIRNTAGEKFRDRYLDAHPEILWNEEYGAQFDESGKLVKLDVSADKMFDNIEQMEQNLGSLEGDERARMEQKIAYSYDLLETGLDRIEMTPQQYDRYRQYFQNKLESASAPRIEYEAALAYAQEHGGYMTPQMTAAVTEYLSNRDKYDVDAGNAQHWVNLLDRREEDQAYEKAFADLSSETTELLDELININAGISWGGDTLEGNRPKAETEQKLAELLKQQGMSDEEINWVKQYAWKKGNQIGYDAAYEEAVAKAHGRNDVINWLNGTLSSIASGTGVIDKLMQSAGIAIRNKVDPFTGKPAKVDYYTRANAGYMRTQATQNVTQDRAYNRFYLGKGDMALIEKRADAAMKTLLQDAELNALPAETKEAMRQGIIDEMVAGYEGDKDARSRAVAEADKAYRRLLQDPAYQGKSKPELDQLYADLLEETTKKYGAQSMAERKTELAMNFYSLTQSMGQSAAIAALSALGVPGSIALLSGSAAEQTMHDLHDKGYSDAAVIASGVIAGFAEYITEEVSIENLLSVWQRGLRGSGADILREIGISLFSQTLSEASEEGASNILNTLADELFLRAFNGGVSEIQSAAAENRRKDPSLSYEDSLNAAYKDWMKQFAQDVEMGALSGLFMGAGGFALGSVQQAGRDYQIGSQIIDSGNLGFLLDSINSLDDTIRDSVKLDPQAGANTPLQVGRLARQFAGAKTNEVIAGRLKQLGIENPSADLLNGISAAANGERLLAGEKKALNGNDTAQQVINEIKKHNEAVAKGKVDLDSWASEMDDYRLNQLMTDRSLGDVYNAARSNELEQRYKELQAENPDSTILKPIADRLSNRGLSGEQSQKQGALLEKIFSGQVLNGKELRALDMNNTAVREVFKELSGLDGVPDKISPQLKATYANRIAREATKIKAQQEEIRKSLQQSADLATAAAKARTATGSAQRTDPIGRIMGETEAAPVNRNARLDVRNMTESQVVAQVRSQSGTTVMPRSAFFDLIQRSLGVEQLSAQAMAAADGAYVRYLGQMNLTPAEIQALTSVKAETVERNASLDLSNMQAEAGTVTLAEGVTPRNEMQQASLDALKKIAELTGFKFFIYETQNIGGQQVYTTPDGQTITDNGFYDPKTGTVYIDINAGTDGQGVILFTAAHEMTHLMKQFAADEYNALKEFLFKSDTEGRFDDMLRDQLAKVQQRNGTLGQEATAAELDEAEQELVADSMEKVLADGDVAEMLGGLQETNPTLFERIVQFLKSLFEKIRRAYEGLDPDSAEGKYVASMGDAFEQIKMLWTEGISVAANAYGKMDSKLAELAPTDIDGDPAPLQYSTRSMVMGSGLTYRESDGAVLDRNGKEVKHVTPEMMRTTPLGRLVQDAIDIGTIDQAGAKVQYEFLAELMNQIIETRDAALIWEVAGTQAFSAIRSNSDKQYGKTIDFSTICKKTQQMVDVMSGAMMELGHGLNRQQVEMAYQKVIDAGEPVPCPVCYVFSRWIGIGGILDDMRRFQVEFANMSESELNTFMTGVEQSAVDFAEEKIKSAKDPTKARAKFYDKNGEFKLGSAMSEMKAPINNRIRTKQNKISKSLDNMLQIQALEAEAQEAEKLGVPFAFADQNAAAIKNLQKAVLSEAELQKLEAEIAELEEQLRPVEAYQYLNGTIALKDKATGQWKKNLEFKPVPNEVLFNLNAGAKFATEYPYSWKYRTTRGCSAGKAMLPYSDARVGETIQGIRYSNVNDIYTNVEDNPFMNGDEAGRKENVLLARAKQRLQNLIGGQRYQSTSDFRFEYGSDYLITFLEMQALGANVQLYTKVIEAVDFLASMGADINLSVMPLGDGYIENEDGSRTLVFSPVTGINGTAAIQKAKQYDNVQLILVGISDEHIRTALAGTDVTFVIPFHGSGNTTANIQTLMDALNEELDVTKARDYTAVQGDHELKNRTAEQKAMWDLRMAIIMGKAEKPNAAQQKLLAKNSYLNDLWRRFYVEGVDELAYRCFLGKDQAAQIFPYEYWDKTSTYDNADINGDRFQEYCALMGIAPRFSGVDSDGAHLGYGDFTKDKGYWKLLIDRSMYSNVYDADGNWIGYGAYRDQSPIDCTNFKVETLDPAWAKATYGDVMAAENDPSKTNEIVRSVVEEITREVRDGEKVMHSGRGGYDYSKSFGQQIEDYKSGKKRDTDHFVFSDTPSRFKDIGLIELPWTYTKDHMEDVLNPRDELHEFSDALAGLPEAIKDPIAIIRSAQEPSTAIVALFEAYNPNHGRNEIFAAAIEINGTGNLNGADVDSYNVNSLHIRRNPAHLLEEAIKTENAGDVTGVYYLNKEKATSVSLLSGISGSGGAPIPVGLVHRITDAKSEVNPKFSSNTQTQQFDRWFSGSKLKDANGDPLTLYHAAKGDKAVRNGIGYVLSNTDPGSARSVYGRLKKPFIVNAAMGKLDGVSLAQQIINSGSLKQFSNKTAMAGQLGQIAKIKNLDRANEQIRSWLESRGFDGLQFNDGSYVVLNENQIKAADNVGIYGANSRDIKHSARDTVTPVKQDISSAATSINANKIPVLYTNKNAKFVPGGINVDVGGGRFNNVTELLADNGVTNMVFDPYNRSEEHNTEVLDFLTSGNRADTVTCSNCLNVIQEAAARDNVILECAKAMKPEGVAYFTVYEGDGTGEGRETKSGWQENRKTASYVDEISLYFNDVVQKGKLIIAKDPKSNLPKATWETTPGTAYLYSSREIMTAEQAAEQLDKLLGKGEAKNLKQTVRVLEARAEAAQQALAQERALHKVERQSFVKRLAEAKKVSKKLSSVNGQLRRTADNTEAKLRREIADRDAAMKKQISEMKIDEEWRVKMARSNGEQELKAAKRLYLDKLSQSEAGRKAAERRANEAERAGMQLALEAEKKGRSDVRAAERAGLQLAEEERRRTKEAERAGMQLALEAEREGEKKAKAARRWGVGLQSSEKRFGAEETRRRVREQKSLDARIMSLPGRAVVGEQRRFNNKAKKAALINDDSTVFSPITFANEEDSKAPLKASEFARKLGDLWSSYYRAMHNAVQELDKMAKLQNRADTLSTWVNVYRASGTSMETMYTIGMVNREGDVVDKSMEEVFLCHDAKGRFDQTLQNALNEYMFHKHNVDRMSLERRAVEKVNRFLDANPWLRSLTSRELAQLAGEGNERVLEYTRLLHWANNVKNKAVLADADNYAVTADSSQKVVDLYENDPQLAWVVDKANEIYRWWDKFMQEWAVGSSISAGQYADMKEMYPHYVPTYRKSHTNNTGAVEYQTDTLSAGQVVKEAKGSTAELYNMEDQFTKSAQNIVRNSRQNDLLRNLVEEFLFDDDGKFSQFGLFDWASADKAFVQAFWDFADVQEKESVETVEIDGEKAFKVSCWVDGVKMSAYVNKAMFSGLNFLFDRTPDWYKKAIKVGNRITQPMKNFITGYNPIFALRNLVRDQHTALTNSKAGVSYWKYVGQAAAKIASNDKDWINFQALGGVSANRTRMEGGFVKAMGESSLPVKIWNKSKEIVGYPGEISESVSRFAEYLAVLNQNGGDTYENRLAALRASAEVTVDFGRSGYVGKVINQWVPYWNANMQGLDKMIRNIIEQPDAKHVIGAVTRAIVVNALPAALVGALLNHLGRWKDYEELSQQTKDTYYCFPVPGKEHKFIKIPKSQDWAAFISTPILRIWEGVETRDDPDESWFESLQATWSDSMKDWFESAVVPNLPFEMRDTWGLGRDIPTILGGTIFVGNILDLKENKNYNGAMIMNQTLKDASPQEQYDATTSVLAYYLGQWFKISPKAADYWINDYIGNFYGTLLHAIPMSPLSPIGYYGIGDDTQQIDAKENIRDAMITSFKSPWIADNRYSNSTMSAYYDMMSSLKQELKDAAAHGSEKEAEHYAIYKALTQSGGFVDQITALTGEARGMISGEDQANVKWAAAGLADLAMEFVQDCLDGKIDDPEFWMTYHSYGDTIMNEAKKLDKYKEDFNFDGKLGVPGVFYDRSGKVDYKFDLKENPDLQTAYVNIRSEEYMNTLNTVINSAKYKDKKTTDAERAAMLEEAKRAALKQAEQRLIQYIHNEKLQGEAVGKADYTEAERAAAYSVSWILGEKNAYKPKLTDEFIRLYDYNDTYSFVPSEATKKTFNSKSDPTKVYVLDDKQQEKYTEIYHKAIDEGYTAIINSQEYKDGSDELRAAMLAKAKTYINDDVNTSFDDWLVKTNAKADTRERADEVLNLEAKYAVQRTFGDSHAMKASVTDELIRLYQYHDVGEQSYLPITSAPTSYVDDEDKDYVWNLDADQREVYMGMMLDIYQKRITQVMNSSTYKKASDYNKAMMLCDARSRLSGEVQAEFKKWLRQSHAPRTYRNGPAEQRKSREVAAASKLVDQILGTAKTYKDFKKLLG